MHTCIGILNLYEHRPHVPEEEKAEAGSRWHCSPLGPPVPLPLDVFLRRLQARLKS